jgi:hypothetical protein
MPEQRPRWYGAERWRRRAALQMKLHPLCALCAQRGEVQAAEIAHHDPSHRNDERAFWFGPLVSVCKRCHDGIVQQAEKRGFHCEIGVDGYPTDPNHSFWRQSNKTTGGIDFFSLDGQSPTRAALFLCLY